ncbi:unnamed protein product [Durusdinium trenchii]|uniref:FHA domain-containing protein n=1 Tax=Durusdinium trenchii TaxID=1381693 RepID=A0ABP0IRZ2_9DINO
MLQKIQCRCPVMVTLQSGGGQTTSLFARTVRSAVLTVFFIAALLAPPVFEDCSTNGSFVNDVKLQKGERQQLAHGDVLSLTKPPEDGIASGPRVQYKLVYEEHKDIQHDFQGAGGEFPATAPDPKHVAERLVEHCFAQDLLVQEQQSKAKLTADLLVSQRKLDEERHAVENLARELQKTRQQVEEERLKRHDAEEQKTKLASEMDALRAEALQLEEVTLAHEDLQARHSASEQEFRNLLGRCEELEVEQLQLRQEVAHAAEAQQKSAQQLAELQSRARQVQERSERLQQLRREAQRALGQMNEEQQRLKEELQAAACSPAKLQAVAPNQATVEKEGCCDLKARRQSAWRTKAEDPLVGAQATLAAIDLDNGEVIQAAETGANITGPNASCGASLGQADQVPDAQGGSTAWSLEVMEIDPPSKKLRRN